MAMVPEPDYPVLVTTPADDVYVRSRFVTLDMLAQRANVDPAALIELQQRSEFPGPTYRTQDGIDWYPTAYSTLLRRAATSKRKLRELFARDFSRALKRMKATDPEFYRYILEDERGRPQREQSVIDRGWNDLVGGGYGTCLKVPWVPCIIRKVRLIREITSLVERPRVDDGDWAAQLRAAVDGLDRLEMPFAQSDRLKFGPVTRDRFVDAVRLRFPQSFRTNRSSVSAEPSMHFPTESANEGSSH